MSGEAKLKAEWVRDDYVAQCNRLGYAMRELVELYNQYARECREKFGEGPGDVMMTGYEA